MTAGQNSLNKFLRAARFWVLCLGVLLCATPAMAQETSEEKQPVDLQADSLQHDEQTQIITASGSVVLLQAGRTLKADQVRYNLKEDTVVASGNVVLIDENGDQHAADEMQVNDEMKSGFVRGLRTLLTDGSRFTATSGERSSGRVTVMHDATYTPCEPCKDDPSKPPVWQIKADTVTHDENEKTISYEDATFEISGVPVAYVPYFSHPDGTVEQKSGFLSPTAGYKSDLGALAGTEYYYAISPNKDATVGMTVMTEQAPLLTAEYRQRWQDAQLEVSSGVTYSQRKTEDDGIERTQDEEVRGHLFAEGLWDIDEKWRAGVDLEMTTDDQYLRQYDFSNKDVLENEIYAERFSGRDYAVGRILSFQDVRVREFQEDQPDVLPEILASFIGEPGSVPVIGGRWSVDGSMLGLRRSGEDQDMNRVSLTAGWQRRLVSDTGLLTTIDASVRGDAYRTMDRDPGLLPAGDDRSASDTRLFPQIHAQASYPVAKNFENVQMTVEPLVAITAAPNIDVNDDIPNEDSRDVQIDASNLFEPNRFPGHDRIEDQSRVTYGVRTGLYGYGGSYGDVFLGQSYRFNEDDNPFPEGSGLNEQESDVVGQISGVYDGRIGADYRFQLESQNMSSQRHEVDAYATMGKLSVGTRYLYAKGLEGTELDESREQIQGSAGYYFSDDWRGRIGSTHDLGEDPGLRRAYLGLDYFGQCLSLSVTGERNLTDDASGDSDTEILFRIGLKNLGEFEASGLRINSSDE
jgi:LPS-assembly protein